MRTTGIFYAGIATVIASAVALIGISPVPSTIIEPPVRQETASITGDAATLVSGRRVTPVGKVLRTQSYSWGMAIGPDERRVALLREDAIELTGLVEPFPSTRIPPYGTKATKELAKELGSGSYMGLAFSPDGARLYYGSANDGVIKVFDLASSKVVSSIDINGDGFADSFVGDFVLSRDGRTLFAVDQFNYRMVVVDLAAGRVTRSVRVGRNPFAIALAPDERAAWVSHVGMFEYPLLPGVTKETRAKTGLTFPAYGVPSKEAEVGVTVDGTRIPGLGSPNHPDAMSVFKVNLDTGIVEQKIKTGYLVGVDREGITTVGGASPGALAVGRRGIYVANATNDTVSIIDPASGGIVAQIELKVPGLEHLRGVLPFTVALAPDESRLYVACAGLNAVAVIDLAARRVAGYIPTGWWCSIVALSRDGQTLFATSAKGLGSGPNGGTGFVEPARGRHPGDIMQGTLQIVAVPDQATLEGYTRQVIANTYATREVTREERAGLPLANTIAAGPIKHIVFVVKENRTFDQVFGQRPTVRGDAAITTLGMNMRIASPDGTRVLEHVDVSPNHQALADAYAISDNFYCDSDQSNTGHRWVVGVYPNEWVEVNARSEIEERLFSSAPGRRYVNGASATVNPEDYNEAGALWEHLARHRISFFNLGFGMEMPANIEDRFQKETGMRMAVSFPLPKPLFDHSSRKYPTFNMAIPDQYRMDMFEEELRDRWLSGKEPFPQVLTMVLPNDHMTRDVRPDDGYPFQQSFFGDNDLALGRLVQTLSRTPWWKDTLIIVTEDDPQGGTDHVDAHRSVLMFIGPHVKKGYVSHTLADFGSVMRLIFTLLHLPPLNHFDAAATLLTDVFTDRPDTTPYRARTVDKRLFDPDLAFKPFDRRFNWKALGESPGMDDPEEMRADYAHDRDDDRERERPAPPRSR
jgi:YVTN family beta-propeller protein